MTNELLKPVADALTAPTAVGSGDLLGVRLIVAIICEIGLLVILVCLGKMLLKHDPYLNGTYRRQNKSKHEKSASENNECRRLSIQLDGQLFGTLQDGGNVGKLAMRQMVGSRQMIRAVTRLGIHNTKQLLLRIVAPFFRCDNRLHKRRTPNIYSAAKTPDIADRPRSGFYCVSAGVCYRL